MVNLLYIDGKWFKQQGVTELLKKTLRNELGAKNVITKSNGKDYLTPEGFKKFKDLDLDEIAAKYQHEFEKLIVEKPKGDEELCFATILKNPGITRQKLFQFLGTGGIPKNTVKTSLWRLETEKELIKSKTDKLGNKGYWSTDKQDYANIEIGEIDKQVVLYLRKKGKSIPEIAKRSNLSEGFVHKILERRKKVGGRPKKEIDTEKIIQLKKEGKSTREIAKELNISHTLVRKELNKLKEQQEPSK